MPSSIQTSSLAPTTKPNLPTADIGVMPETGFLRQRKVLALVPFSRSTLWRRIKERSFPQPVKLSPGITAWRTEDIRSWIAQAAGR